MRGRFIGWVSLAAIAISPLPPLSQTASALPVASQPIILVAGISDQEKGFQDGIAAAKKGGEIFPPFDASEQYKRGYYDGFKQYSDGYKDGADAAREGRPPTLITNPTEAYRKAFDEGYISVAGKSGVACLKEAYRRHLADPRLTEHKPTTEEGVEISTRRGVYLCKLRRGRVVSLSLQKED